jgi:type IV secretion system protein TrbL
MADCTVFSGPACLVANVIGGANKAASGAVNSAVDSGANGLGEAMMGAWDSIMKGFLTSWLDAGMLVSLDGASMQWLSDQLQVISIFLTTVGIMVACVWTMVHARGDQAVKASKALFMVFMVTTAGTALMQVAIPAGDAFAKYILDEAGVTVSGYDQLGPAAGAVSQIGAGLAIVAGIFGVIATLLQWIIMIVRATVLPLLIAVWPVAAAAAMIRGAEGGFSTVTKWLIAFLIYKPVAAIIYAFAWKLKSGGDGIGGVINGMLLLVLAVAALPALMKLLSPATAAMGSAAGGTMAMAAGAAVVGAAVAGGAAVMTGGGSAGAGASAAGTAGRASSPSPGNSTAQGTSPDVSTSGGSGGGSPSGPGGSTGGSGPSGTPGGSGTAGPSGGGAPSSGGLVAGGGASTGASGSSAGLQAASQSLGGAVAQGAKDSDGKGVLGS